MKISDLDDASLLKTFIGLRDRRSRRKVDYQTEDSGDKNKQDCIEEEFLKRFNERGIDNVSTKGVGTAYKTIRTSASVADWDELFEFIQAEGAWEMLERRVNKTAVEQFKSVHADLPPGINWSETQVINFRRK